MGIGCRAVTVQEGLRTLEFLLRLLPQIFGTPGIGCMGSR